MRTQTIKVTMLDVPEGYDFVDLRIPEDGEYYLYAGAVKKRGYAHLDPLHLYPILKPIHKAPELVYYLQTIGTFASMSGRKRAKAKMKLSDNYPYRPFPESGLDLDLILCEDHTVWLGHWNDGLEDD